MTLFLFLVTSFFSGLAIAAESLCPRRGGQTALVIIDMQPGFVTRGGRADSPGNVAKFNQVIAAQIDAINLAKRNNIPIILAEYRGPYGNSNSALKNAIGNYRNARIFRKNTDGMFEPDNFGIEPLTGYLRDLNVGNMIIMGANGGACVQASIEGALDGNCNVLAYTRGIADFNYDEFIYPYVGMYSNMCPPRNQNCRFREVDRLNQVEEAIANWRRPTTDRLETDGPRQVQ